MIVGCGNIVPDWLWMVLSALQVVDREDSGMPWCSCYI